MLESEKYDELTKQDIKGYSKNHRISLHLYGIKNEQNKLFF